MAKSHGQNNIAKIKNGIQKGFLADHYGDIIPISFILDSYNNNQAFFYASLNSTIFLHKNPYTEISLYSISDTRPVFFPSLPLYSIGELKDFGGHYIATSLLSLNYILNTRLKNKYYYIYNINELFNLSKEQIQIIIDSGIKCFTRNDDYSNICKNHFGLKIESVRVPDFNIDKIIQILGVVL